MAFDVSALASYTKDNQDSLVTQSLFDAKTQQLISSKGNVLSEVKSSEAVNVLDTDAVFQAGGTCGFSSSGTSSFTRRTLTIGKIKINESLCPKSLETKWTQLKLAAGSRPDAIPFEKEYSDLKAGKIAQQNETAMWQGDTGSGNTNLNKFDGFLKLIDAVPASVIATNGKSATGTITSTTGAATVAGSGTAFTTEVAVGDKIYGVVTGTYTLIGTVLSIASDTALTLVANGAVAVTAQAFKVVALLGQHFAAPVTVATGITESNVRGIVKGMWKALPAKLKGKDDVAIFCGWDTYESYVGALIEANLFAYTASNDAQKAGEISVPGTAYKLVALHGLDSTNRLVAMRYSNMYMGCDILGEEDRWEIFFAKEADEVRFVTEYKLGVQFAFPDEIVQFKLV
jgi:hypothetical protein